MKKSIIILLFSSSLFACCCHPHISCIPVDKSLQTSIAIIKRLIAMNDSKIFAPKVKELNDYLFKIYNIDKQINQLTKDIVSLKKIQALYLKEVNFNLQKQAKLLFLLNKVKLLKTKNQTLLSKKELESISNDRNNKSKN